MVNPNWLMVLKRIIINTIIFGIGAFDQDAIATGHSYAKEHNGQHQVKQLWAVQLLFVINILKTNKLRFIK